MFLRARKKFVRVLVAVGHRETRLQKNYISKREGSSQKNFVAGDHCQKLGLESEGEPRKNFGPCRNYGLSLNCQ